MDNERFNQLIERMDKLTEAICALVGCIAMQHEGKDEPEDQEPETYLDGKPRK
jgi:hypothetical protein